MKNYLTMLPAALITQVRQALRTRPEVLAAYILGSAVKNQFTEESDIDLAVVVGSKQNASVDKLYESIRHISFPKDLDLSLIDTQSSPLFLFQMVSTGICMYEKSPETKNDFEVFVLKNYYDTQHMRNIYNSYLKQKFRSRNYAN